MGLARWFVSTKVRKATQLRKSIDRILREQEDMLTANSAADIRTANDELKRAADGNATASELDTLMKTVENVAVSRLKPYPYAAARENVKEFLVAVVVIFGFTTFFLQLTKIPTGSMQPTLYGVTDTNLIGSDTAMPNALQRFGLYWTQGIQHFHVKAKVDGQLERVEPVKTVFPFIKRQRFLIGGVWHTVWFTPDDLATRAKLAPGTSYRAGQDVIKIRVVAGDHLLIDRFTYNFRRPRRGEIIVFKTRNIREMEDRQMGDQLYIKRLVALGGETVQIGDDNHILINGERLDASDRHFEHVYGYDGQANPPYLGHLNNKSAVALTGQSSLAPLFSNGDAEFKVRPKHYMAMGDNTTNSWDSRSWGDFPRENVIGRAFFVYWPITDRFGWGYR